MTEQSRQRRYAPIEDYAAIGNLRTVALVGLHGGIDWCCFPYLDSPSVFGRLLDADQGGTFQIAPSRRDYDAQQRYFEHTNVLCTTMSTGRGRGRPSRGCCDLPSCEPSGARHRWSC